MVSPSTSINSVSVLVAVTTVATTGGSAMKLPELVSLVDVAAVACGAELLAVSAVLGELAGWTFHSHPRPLAPTEIEKATAGPSLGILGEAGVNVLKLNLALDAVAPRK